MIFSFRMSYACWFSISTFKNIHCPPYSEYKYTYTSIAQSGRICQVPLVISSLIMLSIFASTINCCRLASSRILPLGSGCACRHSFAVIPNSATFSTSASLAYVYRKLCSLLHHFCSAHYRSASVRMVCTACVSASSPAHALRKACIARREPIQKRL